MSILTNDDRLVWVDTAKGVCIILVVLLNVVNAYKHAFGSAAWAETLVLFSSPFRMPDFFMLSGLFLSRTIRESIVDFMDRKVLHFAYFYLLWLVLLTLAFESEVWRVDPVAYLALLAHALIEPYGGLWFIHMLLIFFAVTFALRSLPKWLVLAAATALQVAVTAGALETDASVPHRFALYYVYFFIGYAFGPQLTGLAARIRQRPLALISTLCAWSLVNGVLVYSGLWQTPLVSLALGAAGALAVGAFALLVAGKRQFRWLTHTGKHSIVVYLTFTLVSTALIKLAGFAEMTFDAGVTVILITALSVLLPLVWYRVVKDRAPLSWLYARPKFARLARPELNT